MPITDIILQLSLFHSITWVLCTSWTGVPLVVADDHPYAEQIRAVEDRIFDVAKRTGATNLTRVQSDLLIVAARDFYNDRNFLLDAKEFAAPTRNRGNENLNPGVDWRLRPLVSLVDIEALQRSVEEQLQKANNADVETELGKMRDKLKVLHEKIVAGLNVEIKKRAAENEVSDLLFSNGVDTYGELDAIARVAEGRLARIPQQKRDRATHEARGIWEEADRLIQIPAKESILERCQKGLEKHNKRSGQHGILLVRRTHLMGPPNWGMDLSAATMEVRVMDDSVRIFRGDKATIDKLIEAHKRQQENRNNGAWHWGRNEAAAPVLEQVTLSWTPSLLETAKRAEELTRGVLILNNTFDTRWDGPLARVVGHKEAVPKKVSK